MEQQTQTPGFSEVEVELLVDDTDSERWVTLVVVSGDTLDAANKAALDWLDENGHLPVDYVRTTPRTVTTFQVAPAEATLV
jgi:hypothetical protein